MTAQELFSENDRLDPITVIFPEAAGISQHVSKDNVLEFCRY
jgi:hypothetical protein